MDTTMAFLVSMGMTVTGQVATDNEQVAHQPEPVVQTQAINSARAEKTRKRIEATNNWTRNIRRAGMTEK